MNILVEKTINPETNRPYPHGMMESALKECHFSVDPTKSAKQQALAMIPKLAKLFPIKRAPMRFKFTVAAESEEEAKIREEEMLNFLKEHEANVETNSLSEEKSDDSNNHYTNNKNTYNKKCSTLLEKRARIHAFTKKDGISRQNIFHHSFVGSISSLSRIYKYLKNKHDRIFHDILDDQTSTAFDDEQKQEAIFVVFCLCSIKTQRESSFCKIR